MNTRTVLLGVCVALASIGQAHAEMSSFTELGFLPGHEYLNSPVGMTDDGRTVVGWSIGESSGNLPYIWRRDVGIAPLSDLIPGQIDSVAISGDGGSIFVGQGVTVSLYRQLGSAPIFNAPAGTYAVQIAGSSSDGNVLTGLFYANGTPQEPAVLTTFLWREGQGLSTITDGFLAQGISADGNFLVGTRKLDPNDAIYNAIRRSADGTETVVETYPFASAVAVSADGSAVIGSSTSFGYRWTAATSSQPIGQLPAQGDSTSPLDISHDGSLVVGYAEGAPQGAFLWDATNGIRSIHELLLAQGVDVSHQTFSAASLISADGHTIVGTAVPSGGGNSAWIVTLVPEPSALVLVVCAAPFVLLARHKRRRLRQAAG